MNRAQKETAIQSEQQSKSKQKIIDESTFDTDIIQMVLDPIIIDKDGNKIEIKVPRPEYMPEIFS